MPVEIAVAVMKRRELMFWLASAVGVISCLKSLIQALSVAFSDCVCGVGSLKVEVAKVIIDVKWMMLWDVSTTIVRREEL